jgi:hypothetical protein
MRHKQLKTKVGYKYAGRTFFAVVLAFLYLTVTAVALKPVNVANAAVPKVINFQGKLTAVSNGNNVANGSYAFEFKLYTASSGGVAVWTETFDQVAGACTKLTVTNGVFNAKLGSCASLAAIDFTGGSMYLTVNFAPTGVSYDGEMAPRKQLLTSAYALVANGVSGDGTVQNTVSSATALTVAKAGTDYALQVDTSIGSAVTGLKITSAAAAGGLALSTLSTGTDENLTLNAKGAGTLSINGTATGNVLLGGGLGGTGCTVTNSNGNFACNGSLTGVGLDAGSGLITGTGGITVTGTAQVNASGSGATTLGNASAGAMIVQGSTIALTSNGAGNDITLTSADQIILQAAGSGTTGQVTIGESSASPDLLVVGIKTTAGNPTAVEGAIYYNADADKFYVAEGAVPAWKEVCNKTDAACGAGSGSAWSALSVPTTNLVLAMDADTTTFNWTSTGALNAWTQTLSNTSSSATTQNLVTLNNSAVGSADTDNLTENLILLQQLDTTTGDSNVVDNFIKIDVAADAGANDGIEITNSAGNLTNGLNIVDTAGGTFTTGIALSGTFTTGIALSGTFTNYIDTPNFDVANSGAVTAVGVNSGTGQIQGTGGLAVTGVTDINVNTNSATNINTGSSNALVTIGGGSGTFSLQTTNIDISSAGAISGATGVTSSGTITFSGLTADRLVTTTTGGQLTNTISSANAALSFSDETGSGLVVYNNSPSFVDDITLGSAGTATGSIILQGTTSGAVTIKTQDAAGTYNFNLPTTAGNSGEILTSAGGAGSPMTWTAPGALAVRWSSLTSPTGALNLTMPATNETTFTVQSTTQTGFLWQSSTLTSGVLAKYLVSGSSAVATPANSGSALTIASTTTGYTAATQTVAAVNSSGANANSGVTVQGFSSTVTNTNVTSGTNIAGVFSASGATTNNYAIIVPSTGGQVGIGTSTPAVRLHVSDTGTSGILRVQNTAAAGYASVDLYDSGSVLRGGYGYADSGTVATPNITGKTYFSSNAVDLVMTTDAGATVAVTVKPTTNNVGINTTGPDRKLDVLDASNPQLRLTQADGTQYTDFQTNSSGDLTIAPSGSDTSITGNLAVSTNLDVAGTIQAGSSNVTLTLGTGFIDADAITLITSGGTGSTASVSGLQTVSDGLGLIQGCSDGQILKWDDVTDIRWECQADSTGVASLQGAYAGGNTISTTGNDIAFTLNDDDKFTVTIANVATPGWFSIENQDTAGTNAQRIFSSNASGTLTNGLLIEQTGAGTMTNAIQILESAGAITDGILISSTLGNILNSLTIDITGAGAITGATGVSSTTGTFSSTLAANGGITFDASTDTVGAFTAAGTIDMGGNILTNIGNTGTDFVGTTGALTLAGVLTANGGVAVANGQTLDADGTITLGDNGDAITLDANGTVTINDANISVINQATDVDIIDNTASAFTISQATNNYFLISTVNAAPVVTLDTLEAGGTMNFGVANFGRTINIGTGTGADVIHIGEGGTTANTITIGTDAVANTITIGSASATDVSITDNNWSVTVAGAGAFASLTEGGTSLASKYAPIGANFITVTANGTLTGETGIDALTTAVSTTSTLNVDSTSTLNTVTLDANANLTTTAGTGSILVNSTVTNASDDAVLITPVYTGGATDALTYNAFSIAAQTATNAAGTDTVNGVRIGNMTESGGVTSTALSVGTGWDTILGGTTAGTNILSFTNATLTTAGALTVTSVNAGSGGITGGAGSFTTLTSTGNTTLATGASTSNTFGSGASSINVIGAVSTPGTLTFHGATTLDNTFTVSGSNLTSLGGNLTVTGTAWTATPTISGLITATSGLTANGVSTFNTDVDFTLAETENIVITNTITGTNSVDLFSMTLTDQTSSGTQRGIVLTKADTTNSVTDSMILIDNAETTADQLTDYIRITKAATNPDTTAIDAIDVSDADLGNALNVGANPITGAGYTITSTASGLTLNSTSAALALQTTTSGNITATTGAAAGLFNVLTGNLKVGDAAPDTTQNGEDAFIEGTLEVDSLGGGGTLCVNVSNTGLLGTTTCGSAFSGEVDDTTNDSLTFTSDDASPPAGTVNSIFRDNTGDLNINTVTGKTLNVQIAGTDEYNFSSTALAMNSNNITGVGTNITATGALTVASGGAGALTLDSASNALLLAASDTSISRTAAGSFAFDLVDGSNTTFALGNSGGGNLNLTVDGSINTNTFTSTALTFSGAAPVISASTTDTSITLNANGTGNINIGSSGTGSILFAGGSGSSGCTITTAGAITCDSTGTFSNISGTNTGDVTLANIGAVPNANGASLSGQQLTLQPANGSFGGVVTTTTQTFAGDKTFTGTVSVPGAGTNSERFGASTTASGVNSLAVGKSASATGDHGTAIGNSATAAIQAVSLGSGANGGGFTNTTVIGYNSSATGAEALAVGAGATSANNGVALGTASSAATGGGGVGIGYSATATGAFAVAIGYQTTATHASSIALGVQAASTAGNQFIAGSTNGYIQDVYFGSGVINTTPLAYTIHGTGGSGSNIAGAALNIAGGIGTGTGNGGDLLFKIAYPGSTGSSANSLTTVATFNGDNNDASGTQNLISLTPTVNQSSTAGYTGLLLNVTETATGSGAKLLFDAQVGGVSKLSVSNAGVVTLLGGQTYDITTATAANANGLTFQPGTSSAASGNGANLVLTGGDQSGNTAATGGYVIISGGDATGVGTATGGNVYIDGGVGATGNGPIFIGSNVASEIRIGQNSASAKNIIIGSTAADFIGIGYLGGSGKAISIGSNATVDNTITIGSSTSTGVSITDNNWSVTTAGVANFITGSVIGSQTFTTNNIVDSGALTIKSASGANALTLDSGTTGTVNLGTGTSGKTINIGTDNTTKDTINIGSALDDVAITGDQWSVTNAGVLTVVSCTGCGGGATAFDAIGDPSGNGAINMGTTVQTLDWGATTTTDNFTLTSSATGLTSGSVFQVTSATTAAVSEGIVQLAASGAYTSSTNGALLRVTANATTAGIVSTFEGTGVTTGQIVNVVAGTGLTTGSALKVAASGTSAIDTNGVVNLVHSGAFTSTSNGGLLNVTANSTTAGVISTYSGTALTTGKVLNLVGGGATALTSGNVLLVTGPSGAAALSGAAGGVVNLTAAGAYTSSNNAGLLNLNAGTATGPVQVITANGLTTGTGLLIPHTTSVIASGGSLLRLSSSSADTGTTTGNLLDLSSSGTTTGNLTNIALSNNSQTSATALTIAQTGVTAGYTGNLINISSTSTTGAATFINLTANASTVGTGQAIAMNALTTGTLLNLASSSSAQSTGKFINIAQTGVTTGYTGNLINLSSSSTTGAATFINLTANVSTTGIGQAITMNALTSGKGLSIASSSTAFTGNLANITLSGSNASNTGNVFEIDNTGALNTNTSLFISHEAGGTGNLAVRINDTSGNDTSPFVIDGNGNVGVGLAAPTSIMHIQQAADSTVTATPVAFDINSVGAAGELTASSGAQTFARIAPTINQTASASYRALEINATETAVTTLDGLNRLIDLRVTDSSSVTSSKLAIRNDGSLLLQNASNIVTAYGSLGRFQNILVRSEEFDNASWTKSNMNTVTANTQVAPDGSTTAESLDDSAAGGYVQQDTSTAITSTTYTFSIWARSTTGTQAFEMRIDGTSSGTGTAASHTATTSWQRFSVTQAVGAFTGNVRVRLLPGGTGTDATIYAWGAQLEESSAVNGYALTTSGALTNVNRGETAESNFATTSGFTYGGRKIINLEGAISASSTLVGQLIRVNDNATGTNDTATVRALEVQSYSGSNINGINTAIAGFGYTFGIHGETTGQGSDAAQPAAVFADLNNGTAPTVGNAIRAYSDNATSADLVSIYQEVTTYTGNALEINLGNGGGTMSGNFLSLQTAGTQLAHVNSTGNAFVSLRNAAGDTLCHVGNDAVNDDEIISCTGSFQADYAEMYPVVSGASVGDVMVSGTQMINTYDIGENGDIDWNNVKGKITKLVKSVAGYQSNMIGIVSDNYGDRSSTGYNIKEQDNPKAIALNGRVPVKVTAENGTIKPGDYLTTSATTPGKAMKATRPGMVLGQALSSYNGTGIAEVMIFVNIFYYDPSVVVDASGNVNLQMGTAATKLTAQTTDAAAYTIDQKGSGPILQLQQDGMDRMLVGNNGSLSLNTSPIDDAELILDVKAADSSKFSINARGDVAISGVIVIKDDTFAGSIATLADGMAEVTFSYHLGTGKPVIQLTAEAQIPVFAQIMEFKQDEDGNYTGFVIKTFDLISGPISAIVHYNVTAKQDGFTTLGEVMPVEDSPYLGGDGEGLVIDGGEVVGGDSSGDSSEDGTVAGETDSGAGADTGTDSGTDSGTETDTGAGDVVSDNGGGEVIP